MKSKTVQIRALKFDGSLHRSWNAEFTSYDDTLLVFRGVFEEEIIHNDLGTIGKGTISYEYYWTDRWYNVFLFREPDGTFRNFYCNINMPPLLKDNVLEYVDLDIDILISGDFSHKLLDLDEFEKNAKRFGYPESVKARAKEQVETLLSMIRDRTFPFDQYTE